MFGRSKKREQSWKRKVPVIPEEAWEEIFEAPVIELNIDQLRSAYRSQISHQTAVRKGETITWSCGHHRTFRCGDFSLTYKCPFEWVFTANKAMTVDLRRDAPDIILEHQIREGHYQCR